MTDANPTTAPSPGSHDRSTPTGSLEVSAATLFEAMLAARDAEQRGDSAALERFYRTLMTSTVLLPVPPGTETDARAALESAVSDEQEVEISVMLARGAEGEAVSVLFASSGSLAAWAPRGTTSLPLPARIAFGNLAAAGLAAVMDPAGPIPYRFEPDEIAALAEGRMPGTDEPILPPTDRRSIRVSLPGPEAAAIETALGQALRSGELAPGVDEAYLVLATEADGSRLLLGLRGGTRPDAGMRLPSDLPPIDVVWLEEPLTRSVRSVAQPFYRRGRG
jgi:hypothetical protein